MLAAIALLIGVPVWLVTRGDADLPAHLAAGAAEVNEAGARTLARAPLLSAEPVVDGDQQPERWVAPPPPAAPASPPSPLEECRAHVAALPLRSKVALLVMVTVDGHDVGRAAAALAGPDRPGGVLLRKGTAVVQSGLLHDPGLRPLIVGIDDEGGRVQRLRGLLPDLPSAYAMAGRPVEQTQAAGHERGAQLGGLGITMVMAPVADVGRGGGLGDRSYSDDPAVVTAYATAYARGLRAAGVFPVVKHFPGHGRATIDSHDGLSTTPDLASLRAHDLLPYRSLLAEGPVGVMVGHVDVPGLTEGLPASLSPAALRLLRTDMGFDGLVITDSIGMGAVLQRFSLPEAAERAVAAGVDVVMLPQAAEVPSVLDRLADAVAAGRIKERRLDAALSRVAAAGCRR